MSVFAGNKLRWAGGAVLVVVAAGLSGIVTMFTLPNVLPGVERGRLADAPIATSAAARSAAAAIALVEDQEPATLDMAERLATAAVMDDPLDVSAIRTLSFVQAYRGNAEQAMRLLRYGESLSRRDLMTELALGLDAQQTAGDAAAIRHYGHALSTTRRGYDLIVTQVLEASQDLAFARALGAAMADRPIWRDRFLPTFVGRSENPEALTAMAQGMWSKGVPVADRGTAAAVTSRLLRHDPRQGRAPRPERRFRGDGLAGAWLALRIGCIALGSPRAGRGRPRAGGACGQRPSGQRGAPDAGADAGPISPLRAAFRQCGGRCGHAARDDRLRLRR